MICLGREAPASVGPKDRRRFRVTAVRSGRRCTNLLCVNVCLHATLKEFYSPAKVSDEALQFNPVDKSVAFKTLINFKVHFASLYLIVLIRAASLST